MARILMVFCLLLAFSPSNSAPFSDEEGESEYRSAPVNEELDEGAQGNDQDEQDDNQVDPNFNENKDDEDTDAKDNNDDENEDSDLNQNDGNKDKDANSHENDENSDAGDENENDNDDDDSDDNGKKEYDHVNVDKEDETMGRSNSDEVEVENNEKQDSKDGDMLDDKDNGNALDKLIMEDSNGQISLQKNSDAADQNDDQNDDDDHTEKTISKLKAIFNEEMPQKIKELKSNSIVLKENLGQLNAKLEKFLRENDIQEQKTEE
ncbi:uncharacterized protein DDB_G0290685-like isoform X1 [Xenia sp. Carnegie-2017]|uniref:uncharacterized protein DDB_G0290685-like isoform X1 n=1 Tax=Xenia sp. Carnegie-2017 TaxID=2897299 RepID=UPI001F04A79F|nr:uncharacterized protein DDB_G0290685-like isoform X1 [Xenia sp. Carnegie-2017]